MSYVVLCFREFNFKFSVKIYKKKCRDSWKFCLETSIYCRGIQSKRVACYRYNWCIFNLFVRNDSPSLISLTDNNIGDWLIWIAHVFDTLLYNWNRLRLNLCDYRIFDCLNTWRWRNLGLCNKFDAGWNPGRHPSRRNLPDPGRECISF